MSRFSILCLFVVGVAYNAWTAPNLYGSRGTMRTHSAKTMGKGKLAAGLSFEGSIDENKLQGTNFFHLDTSQVARDSEGNLVQNSQGWMDRDAYNRLSEEGKQNRDSLDLANSGIPVTADSTAVTEVIDFTVRPFLAVGLTNYFDIGITAPLHIDRITKIDADTQHDLANISGNGLGDIEVWGKFQYPPYEHDPVFDMAFFGMATFPTGDTEKGFIPKEVYYIPNTNGVVDPTTEEYEAKYFSSEQITATLMMLWTLDFYHINRDFPLELNLNYGMTTTVNRNLDNVFILNTSALYHVNEMVGLYTEFAGQTRFSKFESGFSLGADPMNFNVGAQITTPNGVFISLGIDIGVSAPAIGDLDTLSIDNKEADFSDPTQPGVDQDNIWTYYQIQPVTNTAFTAIVGWEGFVVPQDSDRDGIEDKDDACPNSAEDLDNFDDFDGCPEEDNDQDGVEDIVDNCPLDPEDIDGFEDNDGCPEDDNDNDGIKDRVDQCPNAAEDINKYEDEDGCPEATEDSDQDGIPDVNDRCKDEPEDKDQFEDFDGCPDLDNDNDGFKDTEDKCPNAAEAVNGFLDDDGCPDMKPRPKKKPMKKKAKIVLHGVTFESGKSTLEATSFEKLADVGQTMIENPEVVIEISGHTDNRGSKKLNQKLSEDRAAAVVDYLLSLGVGKNQLKSVGYGPDKPAATNRTAEGRAENRRIEMMRIK